MDAAGNIVVMHPILKLAQQWASSPDSADYERAFMYAVNQDAITANTPIFVMHHTAKSTPWTDGEARMLAWTHVWLRHTLLRATTIPCPSFTKDDYCALVLAGAWLRGKAEEHGAGIDESGRQELHAVWSRWTSCVKHGFQQSAQGILTLHFILSGSYLHDALYPNMKDGFDTMLHAIWPTEFANQKYPHYVSSWWKLETMLYSQPGAQVVLRHLFLNFSGS